MKANRESFAGREVRLEGEVVDVRSTSPTVRRGYYRLSDASDPTGVLVRTEHLPIDGGSFRLTAKMAGDQVVAGTLLLDEVERSRVDGRPVLPVLATAVSALGLLLLGFLLRRAVVAEREYAVQPPLWLLPNAGPYGKAAGAGGERALPFTFQPDLEEDDRHQREELRRRKRILVQSLVASLALTVTSAVWAMGTRPVSGQVPAFIFIDSNDAASRIASQSFSNADTAVRVPPPARIDTTTATPFRPDTVTRRTISSVLALAEPKPHPTDPSKAPPRTENPVDSARPVPDSTPVVTPPPPPPPLPAPEVATPAPAVRDPEADRAQAHTALSDALTRLAAAINAKHVPEVSQLLPEAMAGDLGRRDKFMKLVRESGPHATLGTLEPTTVAEEQAEGVVSVSFVWRGDFGVEKRKTVRFQGLVRRNGDAWRFAGARLLDPLP